MDRDRLTGLLTGTDDAVSACRAALGGGAELILWQGLVGADRMLAAYKRRHSRAVADDVMTLGFDEALAGLTRAGNQQLQLGQVTAADPPYVFMVFLAEDPPALVACVGIAQ